MQISFIFYYGALGDLYVHFVDQDAIPSHFWTKNWYPDYFFKILLCDFSFFTKIKRRNKKLIIKKKKKELVFGNRFSTGYGMDNSIKPLRKGNYVF